MKKMVFLDIDGVVANFEGALCAHLDNWDNRHKYSLEERYSGEVLDAALAFANDPNSYYALDVHEDGVALFEFLDDLDYPIAFITSRNGATETFTRRWVKKYFDSERVFCGVKDKAAFLQEIQGSVSFVVDDNPKEVGNVQRIGIPAICMGRQWNAGVFPRIVKDRMGNLYFWEDQSTQELPLYDYLESNYG